jgi:hypothetical protein
VTSVQNTATFAVKVPLCQGCMSVSEMSTGNSEKLTQRMLVPVFKIFPADDAALGPRINTRVSTGPDRCSRKFDVCAEFHARKNKVIVFWEIDGSDHAQSSSAIDALDPAFAVRPVPIICH